jgi:hypothetical protein
MQGQFLGIDKRKAKLYDDSVECYVTPKKGGK